MGVNQTARKIIAIQLLVILAAATTGLVFVDFKAAYSAVVGGGISVISTVYFAYKMFSAGPGSTAREMARAFYFAEIAKIFLTGVLFVAVFLWLDVSFLPLFLTYAATLLAYWLALPLTLSDSSRTP